MDTQQLPPSIVLYQLATGHYVSQAVYVAAKLGIADLLADGPLGHAELARRTGTHPGALRRVMRLLASVGVLAENEDGSFALTAIGACLQSGPGSFRAVAQLFAGPGTWLSWADLLQTVRTGETAAHVFGSDPFEYFATHPEEGAVFDEAMGAFTAMTAVAVAAAYDCSQFGTMIDVGGGAGALLIGVLRATPTLRGIVFDVARVADSARRNIAAAELADRCEFVAGDFFQSVPSGGDAYIMKHVIHDWNDEKATAILRNCRRAMSRAAKLLIVEGVYPQRIDTSMESRGAAANDVNMLVCTGGRQRSEAEFRALFDAAGFKLSNMVLTMARAYVIEGVPV